MVLHDILMSHILLVDVTTNRMSLHAKYIVLANAACDLQIAQILSAVVVYLFVCRTMSLMRLRAYHRMRCVLFPLSYNRLLKSDFFAD